MKLIRFSLFLSLFLVLSGSSLVASSGGTGGSEWRRGSGCGAGAGSESDASSEPARSASPSPDSSPRVTSTHVSTAMSRLRLDSRTDDVVPFDKIFLGKEGAMPFLNLKDNSRRTRICDGLGQLLVLAHPSREYFEDLRRIKLPNEAVVMLPRTPEHFRSYTSLGGGRYRVDLGSTDAYLESVIDAAVRTARIIVTNMGFHLIQMAVAHASDKDKLEELSDSVWGYINTNLKGQSDKLFANFIPNIGSKRQALIYLDYSCSPLPTDRSFSFTESVSPEHIRPKEGPEHSIKVSIKGLLSLKVVLQILNRSRETSLVSRLVDELLS